MLWAQILLLSMFALSVCMDIARHGKPTCTQPETVNAWREIVLSAIGFVILYSAGAFSHVIPHIFK